MGFKIYLFMSSAASAAISSPSANVSMKTKLDLLWRTNKPLFVALIALITLIIFAIIFCIIYFLIIRPRQAQANSTETTTTTAKTAHLLYHGLRSYLHV